jgi:acyl-CoA reductase-like NAD-dependent aldehyde dehydrogenase
MKDRAGHFVEPTILAWENNNAELLKTELFCPILHVLKFKTMEEAIQINNGVPQGLSSSLFTNDMRKVYLWTSHAGSDVRSLCSLCKLALEF